MPRSTCNSLEIQWLWSRLLVVTLSGVSRLITLNHSVNDELIYTHFFIKYKAMSTIYLNKHTIEVRRPAAIIIIIMTGAHTTIYLLQLCCTVHLYHDNNIHINYLVYRAQCCAGSNRPSSQLTVWTCSQTSSGHTCPPNLAVPHRSVTRSPSRPELEAMPRPPSEQVAWPTPQGQQYTSCWPLEMSRQAWTLGCDATVLDDYVIATTDDDDNVVLCLPLFRCFN